jgi:hypothetical protein
VTTLEIIDQIYELISKDRRISAKSIAEQLGISLERVGSIIYEDLDMLVACFHPGRAKALSAPLYRYALLTAVQYVNVESLLKGGRA